VSTHLHLAGIEFEGARIKAATWRAMKEQPPYAARQCSSYATTTTRALEPEKEPEDWTTGDAPMTGPQRSYLSTLCQEAEEEFNESLTKAEASKKIDELQRKTGRGASHGR
jgi:hypothetical protein